MNPIDLILSGALFLCQAPAITDGDTWRCNDGQRVRAWGINAAEMNTPEGPPARNTMARLISGQTLSCERKGKSFNRVVALCRLPDGRDVANEMVCAGMAVDWPQFSRGRYAVCVR